jgi:hypothetical protein
MFLATILVTNKKEGDSKANILNKIKMPKGGLDPPADLTTPDNW